VCFRIWSTGSRFKHIGLTELRAVVKRNLWRKPTRIFLFFVVNIFLSEARWHASIVRHRTDEVIAEA